MRIYVSNFVQLFCYVLHFIQKSPLFQPQKKKDIVPSVVSGELDTVGIRMPSNKIANTLIKFAGVPIAAPSANISGKPSGTTLNDIKEL